MSRSSALQHAVDVARRQAFGAGFDARDDDADVAKRLSGGFLTMPPHPEQEVRRPIDWRQDPLGQRNWRAQLHMLRWLDPIRREAARGNAEHMPVWEEIARDWLRANPPVQDKSLYAWTDMVEAMRAHTLLLGVPYVRDPSWILEALDTHGRWLADPAHLGHSNHALHQHAALFMIGRALENDNWVREALERIQEHVTSEFDDQGVNREAAPGYWLLNYRWTRELARRIEVEGINAQAVSDRLRLVPLALAHASRPDRVLEVIGDTAPKTWIRADADSAELTYVATDGSEGTPPESTVMVFDKGYVFGRSGWGEAERRLVDETFYSLRFGSASDVHGHMDGGGVTYFAQGRPLLVEAGKYAYVSDAMRKYVLGRMGHNVVHIRGREYDSSTFVELVAQRTTGQYDYFRLRDRGYAGVTIERVVVFARASEALFVMDTVRSAKPVTAECRWHIDERASVRATGLKASLMNGRAAATMLWGGRAPTIEVVRGKTDPLDGWLSPKWSTITETSVVKAVQTGTKFRIATAICPGDALQTRLSSVTLDDGSTAFEVSGNGVREHVVIRPDGVEVLPVTDALRGGRPTPSRPAQEPDARLIAAFERENEGARGEIGSPSPTQSVLDRLRERLESGFDYGAAATLRDLEPFLANGPQTPVDSRTRIALYGTSESPALAGASARSLHHYRDLGESLCVQSDRSVHVFDNDGLAIPMLLHRAESDVLVVTLHGALNRGRTTLPRFERVRSMSALGVNVLAIADPTLDLEPSLTLGWYLGTRSVDLHARLADIVMRFKSALSVRRVVFVGSSGGGFAALHLAGLDPTATALVMNPQTDVRRYHPAFSRRALRAIFGTDTPVQGQILERVSVLERYAVQSEFGRVRYVVNSGDHHHVSEHAEPFWDSIAGRPVDIEITWLDLGAGHLSPDLPTVQQLVSSEIGR